MEPFTSFALEGEPVKPGVVDGNVFVPAVNVNGISRPKATTGSLPFDCINLQSTKILDIDLKVNPLPTFVAKWVAKSIVYIV